MDNIRRRSRWLARGIIGVLVMLMAVPIIVAAAVVSGHYPHAELLVRQLPMLFYAWSLWSISRALSDYARSGSIAVPAGKSLQAVGISLFLGGLSNVFAVPLILRASRGEGSVAFFDVSAITLGAVGLSLVVIGRLLADAEAARRELEEFV